MKGRDWGGQYWKMLERDDGWVDFIDWQVPHNYQERKKAWKEWKRCEKEIAEAGLSGWIAGCAIGDYGMIKLFDKLGAKEYYCDGEDLAFYKTVGGTK